MLLILENKHEHLLTLSIKIKGNESFKAEYFIVIVLKEILFYKLWIKHLGMICFDFKKIMKDSCRVCQQLCLFLYRVSCFIHLQVYQQVDIMQ